MGSFLKRSVWLSEEEIGDRMEERLESWTPFFSTVGNLNVYRECEISAYHRPDFICTHVAFSGRPIIEICELKITATNDSLAQVLNYKRIFDFSVIGDTRVTINLFARFFDSDIIEIAESVGVSCYRIFVADDSSLSFEPTISRDSDILSSHFIKQLNGDFGGNLWHAQDI